MDPNQKLEEIKSSMMDGTNLSNLKLFNSKLNKINPLNILEEEVSNTQNVEIHAKKNIFFSSEKLSKNKKFRGQNLIGIPNYGNTCFMNCFIQICVNSGLISLINQFKDEIPYMKNLKLITNLYMDNTVIEKEMILQIIKDFNLQLYTQYDIYDILLTLLNNLNSDCYKLKYDTILECNKCKFSTSKTHILNIINIHNANKSLSKGLKKYFNTETLSFNCSHCDNNEYLQKYVNITLPDILIVHVLKDNRDTLQYHKSFIIFNTKYKLINSVSRIGINSNCGHFYSIIQTNSESIKINDNTIEKSDFYDVNTVLLMYQKVKVKNNAQLMNEVNNNYIFTDLSINKLLCPSCLKPISIKHISEHQRTVHTNNSFSLTKYNKINKDLSSFITERPKIECPSCNKSYSIKHINEHLSKCISQGYTSNIPHSNDTIDTNDTNIPISQIDTYLTMQLKTGKRNQSDIINETVTKPDKETDTNIEKERDSNSQIESKIIDNNDKIMQNQTDTFNAIEMVINNQMELDTETNNEIETEFNTQNKITHRIKTDTHNQTETNEIESEIHSQNEIVKCNIFETCSNNVTETVAHNKNNIVTNDQIEIVTCQIETDTANQRNTDRRNQIESETINKIETIEDNQNKTPNSFQTDPIILMNSKSIPKREIRTRKDTDYNEIPTVRNNANIKLRNSRTTSNREQISNKDIQCLNSDKYSTNNSKNTQYDTSGLITGISTNPLHIPNTKTTCEVCNKQLSTKNIRSHYSRLHPYKLTEYQNKCGIMGCKLSYPTKSGLSFHQKKHHIVEYLNKNFKSFTTPRYNINLKDDNKINPVRYNSKNTTDNNNPNDNNSGTANYKNLYSLNNGKESNTIINNSNNLRAKEEYDYKHKINPTIKFNTKSRSEKRINKEKSGSVSINSSNATDIYSVLKNKQNAYIKNGGRKIKYKSAKQIIYETTGLSFTQFERGSRKSINKYKYNPIFTSNRQLKLPNQESQSKVYRSVSKDIINKYGMDIGLLPTSQLKRNNEINISSETKDNLNNLINGLVKDIAILTNKYTNKYYKRVSKSKKNNLNTSSKLMKCLLSNDYNGFNFNTKYTLKSNERIIFYKELDDRHINLKNIKKWSKNEKDDCLSILSKLSKYENNSNNNLDTDTIKLRESFDINPKYCINKLFSKNKNTKKCEIPNSILNREFKANFNNPKFKSIKNEKELPEWFDKIANTFPNNKDAEIIPEFNYISENEFNQILSKMKVNSSPGPDKISYKLIKNCEGIKILFRKLLNTCLYYGFIPETFKISDMLLIDKNKEDKSQLNNWRPICLTNTISKILTKWISNKLYEINDILRINNKRLFSEEQRGFRFKINGCTDHSNILRCIYEDSKRNMPNGKIHSITNTAIDFKDAFTSIPHYVINSVLNIFKIPNTIKDIIKEYYNNSYLYIKSNIGERKERINILKGVKQGDPLSPVLFNLVLEPLIRYIKASNIGYKFKNEEKLKVGILAYADDVILLSNSEDDMKILLEHLRQYCIWSEVEINPDKCEASSSFQLDNGAIGEIKTNYFINNKPIKDVGYNGQLKYLGSFISNEYRDMVDNANNVTHNLEDQLLTLSKSKLSAIQKIKTLRFYLITQLEFIIRNCYIDENELVRIDTLIRNNVKEWLFLPNNFNIDLIYLPWYDGGLNIFNLSERYLMGKITSYIQTYNSEDFVGEVMRYNQNQYEINRNISKSTSNTDFLNWKIDKNGNIISEKSRTQQVSFISKIYRGCLLNNIKLKYNENNRIYLQTDEINTENNRNRKYNNNYDYLNEIFRLKRIKNFNTKGYQSYKAGIMINNSVDNYILKDLNRLNDNLLRNTLIARTDTFKTNYNKYIWSRNDNTNKYCSMRNCNHKIHNIFHVLQECSANIQFYKDRHDNTCSALYNHFKKQREFEIYYDSNQNNIFEFQIPLELRRLRPDLLLLNRANNRMIIIEVAYINYNSYIKDIITAKENYKYYKYKRLIDFYKSNRYNVEFFPMIFDSTGYITENTKSTIMKLTNDLNIKGKFVQLLNRINLNTIWNTSRLFNHIRANTISN